MVNNIALLIVALYNVGLLAGTAYLIIEYDWSAWWFLLTIAILGTHKSDKN